MKKEKEREISSYWVLFICSKLSHVISHLIFTVSWTLSFIIFLKWKFFKVKPLINGNSEFDPKIYLTPESLSFFNPKQHHRLLFFFSLYLLFLFSFLLSSSSLFFSLSIFFLFLFHTQQLMLSYPSLHEILPSMFPLPPESPRTRKIWIKQKHTSEEAATMWRILKERFKWFLTQEKKIEWNKSTKVT